MKRISIVPLLVAVLLVGCGSDDTPTDDPASPSSAATSTASAQKDYRMQVSDCLEDVGYETSDAGNARRVQSPGGKRIANIQTFDSQREAQAFAEQLEVEGSTGGRGVAVFFRDVDDTATRVVTDCLTP